MHRLARLIVRLDQATVAHRPDGSWISSVARRLAPEFDACWLLMDRDTEAHDNAEHLYRYLRSERPDINAWFVLSDRSPDWERLEADQFRLVPYGSRRHVLALAQCHELVSSQIDHYVVSPPFLAWMRRRPWWFTWLQHGVIQSDLSGWLAGKPARTVVATTPAELRSLTQPPYTWTSKEVQLTGQPRHDALIRLASSVTESERRLLVFMPTWRKWLLKGSGVGNSRSLRSDFAHSEYARNWMGLIGSPTVGASARSHDLELVLLAHPNMAAHLDQLAVPNGVRVANYLDDDVQSILAHASHVITDYSSVAFDAAMIDRPVLYFQFDAKEFFSGGAHIGRTGYFDYARDGFGPVATTLAEAEARTVDLIEGGKSPSAEFAQRAQAAFPARDGQSCRRVVDAVSAHRAAVPSGNGSST